MEATENPLDQMSDGDIAARSGITQAAILRYRKGEMSPTLRQIRKIAEGCDCTVQQVADHIEVMAGLHEVLKA